MNIHNMANCIIGMKSSAYLNLVPIIFFLQQYYSSVLAAMLVICQAKLATTQSHGNIGKTPAAFS